MSAKEQMPPMSLEDLLAGVVVEFDGRPGPFSEYELVDKMRFVLGNRSLSNEERELYYGESNAFFFRGRMEDDDPFPGYFQPTFGNPRNDGTTEWIPDSKDLTPAMTARWKQHLLTCRHPILRARYADLLWNFEKGVEGSQPGIDTARTAIDAYIKSSALSGAQVKNATDWLSRAVGLSSSINDVARVERAVEAAFTWLAANGNPNLPGTWVFLYSEICGSKRSESKDKVRVVAYLESVLAATTNRSAATFDHLSAAIAAQLLANHFRRESNGAEVKRVLLQAGSATEYAASQASPLLALAWLQPLMELYRDAGMNEDATRVQVEARKRGAASQDEMKGRSYTFQIPKEVIDQYIEFLTQPPDITDRMRRWAVSNVQNVERAEKSLIESLTQTPLLARVGITAIRDGQYVAKAGSVEDELDSRLSAQLRTLMELNAQMFVGSWYEVVKAGGIDASSVLDLLKASPAFDPTGINLIAEGLQRFFAEDHLAATHILVPQVERALRTILGLLGRPTNKVIRGEKGTMQEQNMNDALADPFMKELLPRDWHRHLQIVFASRLGFNLRNLIAHGLLPSGQFSSYTSLFALQGLFLLAQIEATATPE